MKKIKFLVAAVGLVIMASCGSAGDKAAGNYTGSYAIDSTATYPVSGTVVNGAITVTKVSETTVDMFLQSYSPSMTDASNGITVTANGNTINFTFTQSTTTEYDMISLVGSITGNSITVDGVMYMSGGNGVGTFTGTK